MTGLNSLNGVNAARGMQGTARMNTATFNPTASGPMSGPAQGMSAPMAAAPTGSSYTRGMGMLGTGMVPGSSQVTRATGGPDAGGVVAGREGRNPVMGMPQEAPIDMTDPNNAAMAGYAFAATQDSPASPSTNPGMLQQAAPGRFGNQTTTLGGSSSNVGLNSMRGYVGPQAGTNQMVNTVQRRQ